MSGRLAGRVAVVTGGGAGIGAAIAQRLAQDGAQVLVADIDGDAARQTSQNIEGSMACQVGNPDRHTCPHMAPER